MTPKHKQDLTDFFNLLKEYLSLDPSCVHSTLEWTILWQFDIHAALSIKGDALFSHDAGYKMGAGGPCIDDPNVEKMLMATPNEILKDAIKVLEIFGKKAELAGGKCG